MLFDDDLAPEIANALQTLEDANEMGVPWPFDPQADLALLKRIKSKHPKTDVAEMTEKFLVWCLDSVPWKTEEGKPQQVRWRSRLWTWARNNERFTNTQRQAGRAGRTHRAAEARGDGEATEAMERW